MDNFIKNSLERNYGQCTAKKINMDQLIKKNFHIWTKLGVPGNNIKRIKNFHENIFKKLDHNTVSEKIQRKLSRNINR